MELVDGEIIWWRVDRSEVRGQADWVVGDGAWRGRGALAWQLVHQRGRPGRNGSADRPARFELSCPEIEAIGGFWESFPTLSEAFARAEGLDRRARSRSRFLGDSRSRRVVLWPDDWIITGSSEEIDCRWNCPFCDSESPAYKVVMGEGESPRWMCSSCSMPLEWRESPDRFRLSGIELDRLDALDLEREWDVGVTAVEEGQFYIHSPVAQSAVHSLRRVWLPSYLTTRTVLCCEEADDGDFRWVIFVNDETRLVILLEASEKQQSYLGHFVEFGSLGSMLDTIERWDIERGWVDQLPDRRDFWLRDNKVFSNTESETELIEQVLFPGGNPA